MHVHIIRFITLFLTYLNLKSPPLSSLFSAFMPFYTFFSFLTLIPLYFLLFSRPHSPLLSSLFSPSFPSTFFSFLTLIPFYFLLFSHPHSPLLSSLHCLYLSAPTAAGDADSSMSLSDHFERKSRTNDLFQYVFSSVAGKKGHVVIDDVIQWDFTQVHHCCCCCCCCCYCCFADTL